MSRRMRGTSQRSRRVSTFPGHWAGFGLLLLRAAVGGAAVAHAWLSLASTNPDPLTAMLVVALALCGAALIFGLFTLVSSSGIGLAFALVLFTPYGAALLPRLGETAALLGLSIAAALGLLGPGAFSIDARLFGRREIFIPGGDGG